MQKRTVCVHKKKEQCFKIQLLYTHTNSKNVKKVYCKKQNQNIITSFLSIGRYFVQVLPVVSSILSCIQFYSDIIIMGDHDHSRFCLHLFRSSTAKGAKDRGKLQGALTDLQISKSVAVVYLLGFVCLFSF